MLEFRGVIVPGLLLLWSGCCSQCAFQRQLQSLGPQEPVPPCPTPRLHSESRGRAGTTIEYNYYETFINLFSHALSTHTPASSPIRSVRAPNY